MAEQIMRWGSGRLREAKVVGSRHRYLLVLSHAKRFVGPGAALIGNATVGMCPVAAHGFNFWLRGQRMLADNIERMAKAGGDIGMPSGLLPFGRQHQRAMRPLYLATNALVRLYTNESVSGTPRKARDA